MKFVKIFYFAFVFFIVMNVSMNDVMAYKFSTSIFKLKIDPPLSENSTDIKLHIKFGDAYLGLYEIHGIRYIDSPYRNSLQDAEKYYKKALQLDSKCSDAYHGLGNISRAYREYYSAIKDAPWAKMFLDNGIDFEKNIESAKNDALSNYYKAISLNPNNVDYYVSRAGLYEDEGQFSLAIEDYTKAISLDSNDFYTYMLRGNAYYCLKNYDLAENDFKNAIKIIEKLPQDEYYKAVRVHYAPRNIEYEENKYEFYRADSYDRLGKIYFDLKNYQKAFENFDEAVKIKPQDSHFNYDLARAFEELKDYPEALNKYNEILKTYPRYRAAKDGKKRVEKIIKNQNKKK